MRPSAPRPIAASAAFAALLGLPLLFAASALASVLSVDERPVPLTKDKLLPGTTWSKSLALGERGLEPRPPGEDVWIESPPLAVGMAWRPPSHATLWLAVEGTAPGAVYGWAFVRFGCDALHWSTWNAMAVEDRARPTFPPAPGSPPPLGVFTGNVGVPRSAIDEFEERRAEWRKTGPAWESDDDEYARWLLARDPRFFERHLPFVGWVQFRFELSTVDPAVRLNALRARVTWAVGGMHVRPRDGKTSAKESMPWHLDARPRPR